LITKYKLKEIFSSKKDSFNLIIYSVESNEDLGNSLSNKNKFKDLSQNVDDKWPKLQRKKESSYYNYLPNNNSLDKNEHKNKSKNVKSRRGVVGTDAEGKVEVTFMSTLNQKPWTKKCKDCLRFNKPVILNQVVDEDNYDDELGMDASEGESEDEETEFHEMRPRMRSKLKSQSGSEGHENIVLENCGISKGLGQRIVNGREAAEGTYPWIVAILKYGDAWY
jgi:hypothetical protein